MSTAYRRPSPTFWLGMVLSFVTASIIIITILTVSWVQVIAVLAGLLGLIALAQRPYLAVVLFVALRLLLDIMWWIEGEILGLNLLQLASGAMAVTSVGIIMTRLNRAARHPLSPVILVFWLLVILGAVRAASGSAALVFSVELATPWLLVLLVSILADSPIKRLGVVIAVVAGGAIPVVTSIRHVISGTGTYELHGFTRLLGEYQNLHNHALVMATVLLCCVALLSIPQRWWTRAALGTLTLGAAAAMYLTYVRTSMLGAAIAIGLFLVVQRRWRWLAVLALVTLVALATNGALQERFSDLIDVFTVGETESRDNLGSGRWYLWRQGINYYLNGGPANMLIGNGLGHHRLATAEGMDPHSDVLSVAIQAGPLAVIAWLTAVGISGYRAVLVSLRGEHSTDRTIAALCLGLIVIMLISATISNGFITRVSLAWVAWAMLGALFTMPLLDQVKAPTKRRVPTTAKAARSQSAELHIH